MGARRAPGGGDKRKPTAQKMQDNARVKGFPDTEAAPDLDMPYKPDFLSQRASDYWDMDAPKLLALGLLTEIDGQAFGMLCQARVDLDILEAEKQALTSYLHKAKNGVVTVNPIISAVDKQRKTVLGMLREFGLSPSSRSGVTVAKRDNKSAYAEWKRKKAEHKAALAA